ncbi:non-ribosomal peptide synthetase/type I polyketide synthase [Aliikangiella coralliicola]|uniref:Amino acid adenylation domain-containing protein n=1 Tax=Aliikangiella coralliicola TaxID=2592383 RepID=A0A545U917_9GAMM|nr:non-ribosomal peptide synthetase/type I polyketide synthase [Aliikangiella coralliicola]TQV85971.1 amino acid adenylation domain-containing protein [Aliikangiella coralliicola]
METLTSCARKKIRNNALNKDKLDSQYENFSCITEILSQRAELESNVQVFNFISEGEKKPTTLTFETLHRKATRIARRLLRQYQRGDRLLLLFPPGEAFVLAFYGCLYAGIVAVPTYAPRKNQNLTRLKKIILDANAKAILSESSIFAYGRDWFVGDSQLADLPWLQSDVLLAPETNLPNNDLSDTELPSVSGKDIAMLQYTSGSTGNPKGVVVLHQNIMNNQMIMQQALQHDSTSVGVSWLPHFHDMGLFYGVVQPVYAGFLMHLMSPAYFSQKPIRWLQAISRFGASTSGGPNFAYDLCVDTAKEDDLKNIELSSWKLAFNGAETVSAKTLDNFVHRFKQYGFDRVSFFPCYGMAEMTLIGTTVKIDENPQVLYLDTKKLEQGIASEVNSKNSTYAVVSTGKSWANHHVAIVNPNTKCRCADSEVGEIWFKGKSVADGYWNNVEASEENFQAFILDTNDGPYLRTGDLGFVKNDELYVSGRCKDILIIRGRNYYPQDIEAIPARESACVKNGAAAFTIQIENEERLILVQEIKRTYIRKTNHAKLAQTIKKNISQECGILLYDIVLIKPNRLLKTSSGKIQRQANKKAYLDGQFDEIYQMDIDNYSKVIKRSGKELQDSEVKLIDNTNTIVNTQKESTSKKHSDKFLETAKNWLVKRVAELTGASPAAISCDEEFSALGLDSRSAIGITGEFSQTFDIDVPPTHIYDYPTINQLCSALVESHQMPDTSQLDDNDGRRKMAIIGLSCRFPQAENADEFWALLKRSDNAITEPPGERLNFLNKKYRGGYLQDISQFDANLFSISPKEAKLIDPQQRILLEQSFEALLAAGYQPKQLSGSKTGVFIGISASDYRDICLSEQAQKSPYFASGNSLSIAANRLSYFYDFRGPSIAVDTACSSSLVAFDLAVQSLRKGDCDLALVGGVQLNLLSELTESLDNANMLAADGHCKVFDASADGYVRGEGCGVVVLKCLSDARQNRDKILAVVSGGAVYQDGRSNGLNAPNGLAQQAVIKEALADAKVTADSVSYVEAHGTGTELGDPIELRALDAIYGQANNRQKKLLVGSVKANIGHLEAAAGIAGLIKTILCLANQTLTKQLHFNNPNPHIDWDSIKIRIPNTTEKWTNDSARYAAVSSFGFGGTNAHIILEQAPGEETTNVDKPIVLSNALPHLLVLSAHSDIALSQLVTRYREFIKGQTEQDLKHICYTAAITRPEFKHRAAISFENKKDLVQLLEHDSHVSAESVIGEIVSGEIKPDNHDVAFIYTGQGSQYPDMGKALFDVYPVFRDAMKRCDEIFKSITGDSLLKIIYSTDKVDKQNAQIHQTQFTQPALFALEYSLTQLWFSWGVKPSYVMGHSAGEIVAATIAGILSLEDGLKFITARSRLMQQMVPGKMLSILAKQETVANFIRDYSNEVTIAAVNGPTSVVISGVRETIDTIQQALEKNAIISRELNVSHAFHSPLMNPMLPEMESVLNTLDFHPPKIKFVDNLTSKINNSEVANSHYWLQHIRSPVQFFDSIKTLIENSCHLFLEIGPTPNLSSMGAQCVTNQPTKWLPSLRPGSNDLSNILRSLGSLFVQGFDLKWQNIFQPFNCERTEILPHYFQRQHFWIKEDLSSSNLTLTKSDNEHSPIAQPFNTSANGASPSSPVHSEQDTASIDLPNDVTRETTVKTLSNQEASSMATNTVLKTLKEYLAKSLGSTANQVDINSPLIEIGADSLIIVEFARQVETKYELTFSVPQFFQELATLNKLATYIVENSNVSILPASSLNQNQENSTTQSLSSELPREESDQVLPKNKPFPSMNHEMAEAVIAGIPQIMNAQLQYATQVSSEFAQTALVDVTAQQLNYLRDCTAEQSLTAMATTADKTNLHQISEAAGRFAKAQSDITSLQPSKNSQTATAEAKANTPDDSQLNVRSESQQTATLPPWKIAPIVKTSLQPAQQRHLDTLTEQYTKKTAGSKQLCQEYRAVCADGRASAGFRLSTKEMLYPIYGDQAKGAKTWDIDGNEYIDITMGFGVNLFGHQPEFVTNAISNQLNKTMQLGLQTRLSGEVARLLCELTGMSRVTFCNSGTEAVMTALRIARASTNRKTVVQFKGSYHGHYDGTLAEAGFDSKESVPLAPGVNQGAIENVVLLEYGSDEALETIASLGGEVAAVLVEPVQSRHPDLQPAEFLTQLRQITTDHNIVLIFDEMITGFRILPGGAQEWFGVEADMATYGKIVGGGMPIGVLAGRGELMDQIDGGCWQYGDDSFPQSSTTFFAGTFCKHPLTMAAAHAVLNEIKKRGQKMYGDLNRKSFNFVNRVNSFFQQQQVPIELVHYGSLFRFVFSGNLDVLFYNFLNRGLYIWEGRNCFLSTAHTDSDIDKIYNIIVESVTALINDGFFAVEQAQLSHDRNENNQLAHKNSEVENMTQTALSVGKEFPMLEAQQQLWAIDNIDEQAGLAYHVSLTMELTGNLQKPALKLAYRSLIDRHPAFRVCFSDNGESQYYQATPDDLEITELDFSNEPIENRSQCIESLIDSENNRPFDLTQDLLVRLLLIRLDSNQYLLHLRTHHIVSDGLSLNILLQELTELYSANCQQTKASLPPAMAIDEYVNLHKNYDVSAKKTAQEKYWLSQFSGELPVLNLPYDYHATKKSYLGNCYSLTLPEAIVDQAKQLARQHQCTLFMALFSLYALWLHKLSGQRQLVIGFPVSGRGIADKNDTSINHLIGYCTHLLPVLSTLEEQDSVNHFISATRNNLLHAYENQDYPYAKLLKQLQHNQDLRENPLIGCVFNLDSVKQAPRFYDLETSYYDKEVSYVDFDISFNFIEAFHQSDDNSLEGDIKQNTSELTLECEYRSDRFKESTIARFIEHFITLLDTTASQPDLLCRELSLLTQQQKSLIISDWNQTNQTNPSATTFIELFERQVKRRGNKPAVVFKDEALTYQSLNHRVNQLAHLLLEQGVNRGDIVAVYLDKSVEQIQSVLSVLKCGAAYLPIDGSLSAERVEYLLEDAQAKCLITQSLLQSNLQQANINQPANTICLDKSRDALKQYSTRKPTVALSGTDLAYLIYTSGSTGNPKGVLIEHKNLVSRYYAWEDCFSLDQVKDAVHLQMAAFSFDVFTGDFIRALGAGAKMVMVDKETILNAEQLFQTIQQHRVTCAEFVPAIILSLCDYLQHLENLSGESHALDSFRTLIVGSDTWYIKDLKRVKSVVLPHTKVINTYGVTEATIDSSYFEANDLRLDSIDEKSIVPIGIPMNNVRLYIVDNYLQPQPVGVVGELLIGGDSLAKGYLNQAELTRQKFIQDPFVTSSQSKTTIDPARVYRTGDFARFQEDGVIEFLGRLDDQVKIRGHRVELGEVEFHLGKIATIDQCVVLAKANPKGNMQLIAYVVCGQQSDHQKSSDQQSKEQASHIQKTTVSYSEVVEQLRQTLPDYMLPAAIVQLDKMPHNSNGKLDKKALLAMEVELSDKAKQTSPEAKASTDNEKVLAAVYSDLFTRESIGIHENFFELGGDSITAIQMVSRLRQHGLACKASDIFAFQTIHELAQRLSDVSDNSDQTKIATSGSIPPNPIQAWCYEQQLENLNHWNQALLLTCQRDIQLSHLQQALDALVNHHGALKTRFEQIAPGRFQQSINQNKVSVGVLEFDATQLKSDDAINDFINQHCDPLNCQLNIESGQLVKAALVRMPTQYGQDRLFITINHLVIDGVSWRIVLDDLQRAIQDLRQQRTVVLQNKTVAFSEYCQRIQSYVKSNDCQQDLAYWQSVAAKFSPPLPRDFTNATAYESSLQFAQAKLDAATTKLLLENANSTYRTEINELLLSALSITLHRWTGNHQFKISLEGHGRDPFTGGMDLSHTIGWFTSVYPVYLSCEDYKKQTQKGKTESDGEAHVLKRLIQNTKENVRQVPQGGFSYSPLRYLHEDKKVRDSLGYDNLIEFNYLGQTDNMNIEDVTLGLSIVNESMGQTRAPENRRTNELEIDVIIVNQQLAIKIAYAGSSYRSQTIDDLAENFIRDLKTITRHCVNAVKAHYTPSDFPLAKVSQREIETLIITNEQPQEIENLYPLSSLQAGMFYHSINESGSQAYIDQLHCEFNSDINVRAFENAWQQVIARHSIFRTAFLFEGLQQPLQRVHSQFTTPLEVIDISSQNDPLAHFKVEIAKERRQGLTPETMPLMRFKLYKMAESHFGFVWTFHHAIMDGWSLANALEEFLHAYDYQLKGKALAKPQSSLSKVDNFADYIAFLQNYDKEQANRFWGDYLAGFETPTQLHDSRQEIDIESTAMGEESIKLEASLYQQIDSFAKKHHLTQNTLIQAAWSLVIQLYSQQQDIVFGVTCSGRPASLSQVEDRVGLYINTLPLRVQFDSQMNCLQWLKDLQKNQSGMLDYQYSSLTDIQRQSSVAGDQVLLNILLVCENYPINDAINQDNSTLSVTNIATPEHTNFPISLEAALEEGLQLKITYKRALFNDERIKQILSHLQSALTQLSNGLSEKLADIQLISDAERHYLLQTLNQTAVNYPREKCLHQLFEEQVLLTPDRVALTHRNEQLTYREFNCLANGLAKQLSEQGVTKGDRIPVIAEPGMLVPLCYLAIMKCGAVFAPIDIEWPQNRIESALHNMAPKITIIQGDSSASRLKLHTPEKLEYARLNLTFENIVPLDDNPPIQIDASAPIYVIHTSGSTGQPKGAINVHRGIVNRLSFMDRYFGFQKIDVILQTTHHCFDSSVWQYFWPLVNGGQVVLPDWDKGSLDIDALLDLIQQKQVTVTDFTPSVLATLYQHLNNFQKDNVKLASLRALLIGGEALSISVIKGIQKLQPDVRLINCYGPSETSIGVVFYDIPKSLDKVLPIGRPIDNVRAYILDKEQQPVPTGVIGELYIGGDCVGLGYIGNENITRKVFVDDPFLPDGGRHKMYRTGDYVRYLESGNIEFIGRLDEQVKIRGFRIELAEIEKEINRNQSIKSSCVLVRENPEAGAKNKILVAFISTLSANEYIKNNNKNNVDIEKLRLTLQQRLPHYMVPSIIHHVDKVPITTGGKVDKKALEKLELNEQFNEILMKDYVAPGNSIESQLVDIFTSVLLSEKDTNLHSSANSEQNETTARRIGIYDNFFDLGGHSLLATLAISQIRRQLEVDIKVKALFQYPNAASLAKHIGKLDKVSNEDSIVDFSLKESQQTKDGANLAKTNQSSDIVMEEEEI